MEKLLIANRGKVAIRIARAAAERGVASLGICSSNDQAALHNRKVDESVTLTGSGTAGCLDGEQMIQVALDPISAPADFVAQISIYLSP